MHEGLMAKEVERLIAGLGSGVEQTPGIWAWEPRGSSTWILAWTLEQARRLGAREADLLRDSPGLREADPVNAWSYVASHREEIEGRIRANEQAKRVAASHADENSGGRRSIASLSPLQHSSKSSFNNESIRGG